jgi:hypothetical protein
MATRRVFLASLLATGALPRLTWAEIGQPAYLAAARTVDGSYRLHGISLSGQSLFQLSLPGRGHAATAHPARAEAVAFARRPGTFAMIIDCASGNLRAQLSPPDGRQFNGHGAYSADGSLLMTSEVVADTSEGRIGLWETAGYGRVGEWASGGIGPHDVRLMPDGMLAVANGGIQTDPNDRAKLNISSMRPNLSYLDANGLLVDQVELDDELHQNSIRHLALSGDGTLAFAMQWEGDPAVQVPLLGLHRRGSIPKLCAALEADAAAMQGYAGSIAFNGTGDLVALTSPKGGAVMIFDRDGSPVATHRRADLCGAAPASAGFTLTDGAGAVWSSNRHGLTLLSGSDVSWDNHLIALGAAVGT